MPYIKAGTPLTHQNIFNQPKVEVFEASAVGFKPGQWMKTLQWKGQTWTAISRVMENDELAGVYYGNAASHRILIIND